MTDGEERSDETLIEVEDRLLTQPLSGSALSIDDCSREINEFFKPGYQPIPTCLVVYQLEGLNIEM